MRASEREFVCMCVCVFVCVRKREREYVCDNYDNVERDDA